MTTKFDYSVVVPVYNSELSLRELVERLFTVFQKTGNSVQIVLVNDGSTDGSWKVIDELKQKHGDSLRGIDLARNFGQHNALSCGFFHADGDAIITLDDDLQHPPEEIPKMLETYKTHNADVVYGMYVRKTGFIRRVGSRQMKKDSVPSMNGQKGGSPFRVIKASLVKAIAQSHAHSFIYIDTIITWYTRNIYHVNVEHHTRKHGKTGYSLRKLVGLYWDIVINYSAAPLRWMTFIGTTAAFTSFIMGAYFIYRKLAHNVPLGYTSIIVTVLFGTGLIMLSLGIIGQYLYKSYQMQYQKPAFHVQKVI